MDIVKPKMQSVLLTVELMCSAYQNICYQFFSMMTCIVSSFCMSLIINADSHDGKVKLRFTGTQFCKAGFAGRAVSIVYL